MFAPEIFERILSNLSFAECYHLRSVCYVWMQRIDYYLYKAFKCQQKQLHIVHKQQTLASLIPYRFDEENKVIEFRPADNNPIKIQQVSYIQLHFSQWKVFDSASKQLRALDIGLRAQALFHLGYNPSREQLYEIPPPLACLNSQIRYIGDPGVIICFSYSSNNVTADPAIVLKIHSICVHLSWLLSGIDTQIVPQEIYVDRYLTLRDASRKRGVIRFNKYSEPVLTYIMANTTEALESVLSKMSTNDVPFVRQQIQTALKSFNIDPRVIWKYTFVKRYILEGQCCNEHIMQVVERIKASEEEWQKKKQDLLQQLVKVK